MKNHNAHSEHSEYIDSDTGKMGMWLFLFTELFLFGGLFIVYAVMRSKYGEDFHHAALELNAFIGATNTVVLLVSSMTVAMSLTAIQKKQKNLAIGLIFFTILLAGVFLVNKYFFLSSDFWVRESQNQGWVFRFFLVQVKNIKLAAWLAAVSRAAS